MKRFNDGFVSTRGCCTARLDTLMAKKIDCFEHLIDMFSFNIFANCQIYQLKTHLHYVNRNRNLIAIVFPTICICYCNFVEYEHDF